MAWQLILALCTILGLLFTGQVLIDYAYAGHRLAWWRALAVALAQWYFWAIVSPAIVWLARRFRIDRRRWPGSLAVHVPASVVFAVAKQIADTAAAVAITGVSRGPFSFIAIEMAFLIYWVIVGATYAVENYQKYRERELAAARLETALTRAELQSLRMQIHPHFLFNTLNGIAALMREDVEAADVMMARLCDLLRVTLASAHVPEVTLRRELELVEMYFDIQRARMGPRLRACIEAAADTLEAAVPTLSLQPVIENAFRHGAGARPGPARIDVRARCEGAMLVIEVFDDGPGPGSDTEFRHGLGNTQARLTATHGAAATLELIRRDGGGALARMRMPIRPVDGAGAGA